MRKLLTLLVPALALLVGCATSNGGPAVEDLTFVGSKAEGFELLPGTQVSLSFSGEQISASAGCNTLFGRASWKGNILDVSELAMTAMGCEGALHDQDDALGEILTNNPKVTYEGRTLTMEGSTITTETDVVLELEEVLDEELEGTHWNLTGLEGKEAVSSLPSGVSGSLMIEDGHAEIDFGCNTGGGEVKIADSHLDFGNLVTTRKACGEDETAVEDHVLHVLHGTVQYEIDGPTLVVRSGGSGLHFRVD